MPQGSAGHTTDHREIRRWAEARDAHPGRRVDGSPNSSIGFRFGQDAGDPPLEPLGWDEFFALFDELELAMLYREENADGSMSSQFEFVPR